MAKQRNRLTDIETEEVGIVDRGANRRRFLVRKRDAGAALVQLAAPSAAGIALQKALEDFIAAAEQFSDEANPQAVLPSELLAEIASFVGQFPSVAPDALNRTEEGPMEKRADANSKIRQRIANRATRMASKLARGKFDRKSVSEMQQLLAMMRQMMGKMPKGQMHKNEAGIELVGNDAMSALFEHAIAGDEPSLDTLEALDEQDVATDALDAAEATAAARLAEIEAEEKAAAAPPAPVVPAVETPAPAPAAEPPAPVAPVVAAAPAPIAVAPAPVAVAPVAEPPVQVAVIPAVIEAEIAKLRADIAKAAVEYTKTNEELRATRAELNKALGTPGDRGASPEPTAQPRPDDEIKPWMFPDNYNDPEAKAAFERANGKS